MATSQIAQTTLRSLLGREELDTVLAHREDLNERLGVAGSPLRPRLWGVDVRLVEIKDVEIPEAMQRAMAKEAEAERERRAKIINARGELQASAELRQGRGRLSARARRPCNCATYIPCSNSARTRTPRSSSRFRWTSSARFSKRGRETRAVPATLSPTSGG